MPVPTDDELKMPEFQNVLESGSGAIWNGAKANQEQFKTTPKHNRITVKHFSLLKKHVSFS